MAAPARIPCVLLGVALFAPTIALAEELPVWAVSGGMEYAKDSDTIFSGRQLVQAEHDLADDTILRARFEHLYITAERSSGLAAVSGDTSVNMKGLLLGAEHKWDMLTFSAMAGLEQSSEDTETPAFEAKVDWRFSDELQAAITVARQVYDVSPKAISRDVNTVEGEVELLWRPAKRWAFDAYAAYADFTDGNERRHVRFSPRYRLMRWADSSLDAGLRVQWFGFDHRSRNGYFSPESYQAYNLPVTYYRQFGEHHLLLSASPGIYREHNVPGFHVAGDATLEAGFRLNDAWNMTCYASMVRSGGSLTNSNYEQRLAGMTLTHRF